MNVEKLWVDGARQMPRDYFYYDRKYEEEWEIPFERTEEEIESEEFVPMMNYFYPLPDFEDKRKYEKLTDKEIKRRLDKAGSVTLVHDLESGEYGLALTGGGMDFSWDICRGYIYLGYLPPAHFCDLPDFAGLDVRRPENKVVIDACKRTFEHVGYKAERLMEKLKRMEEKGL